LKFKKKLVSKVKQLRDQLGIPQQKLAKLAKVSRQTIYYLETAKEGYNPSLTLSFEISRILGKPIEEIFYFEPIIRDFLGDKTMNEIDEVAEITGIETIKIWNLKKIDDDQLSEMYSEEELIKIAEAFGVKFQDLFLKDEEEI
jgi:putative transcriptional regulator